MHAGLSEVTLLRYDDGICRRRSADDVDGLGIGPQRHNAEVQWLRAAHDIAVVIALRNRGPIGVGCRSYRADKASFVIRQRTIRSTPWRGGDVHDTRV